MLCGSIECISDYACMQHCWVLTGWIKLKIEVSCLYIMMLSACDTILLPIFQLLQLFYYSGSDVLLLLKIFMFYIVLLKLMHLQPVASWHFMPPSTNSRRIIWCFSGRLCDVRPLTPTLRDGIPDMSSLLRRGLHFDKVASRLTCSVWNCHSSWIVTFSRSIYYLMFVFVGLTLAFFAQIAWH